MSGSAGTAGKGYKVAAAAHDFQPDRDDYGRRSHCVCGAERAEHDRLLRSLEQPVRRAS